MYINSTRAFNALFGSGPLWRGLFGLNLAVPKINSFFEAAAKVWVWNIAVSRQNRFFRLSPFGGRFGETG
jgi:hypothetical protein